MDVTAAILLHEGKILIARRKAGDHLEHLWEFPGGKIEKNETPEQCLKREMKEEFQIEVEVGEFFGESVHEEKERAIRLLAYWSRWIDGCIQPMVHEEIHWVDSSELDEFVFAPADRPFVQRLKHFRCDSLNSGFECNKSWRRFGR